VCTVPSADAVTTVPRLPSWVTTTPFQEAADASPAAKRVISRARSSEIRVVIASPGS
jgi:hypothetical protein